MQNLLKEDLYYPVLGSTALSVNVDAMADASVLPLTGTS
jgi:hypothetical protein